MPRHAALVHPYPLTAWSAVSGLGAGVEATVERLREGRHALVPCPVEVPFETVCGVLPEALPAPPASCSAHDTRLARAALLGYEGVAGEVARAVGRWGADRVALIVSTSTGGIAKTERAYFAYRDAGSLPGDYDYDAQHPFDAFTDVLAAVSGISGPRYVVSTACSSSGKVFASARRLLDAGVVDAALVGGVDTLCLTTLRGFHSLGVLSPVPCRPFGRDRPGMNIGEGAGFVLLEREGDARACLLGVGESSDAFHMSAPHPEGRGALAAMGAALAQAGLGPGDVDHVNAHGTGTAANDVAEALAISQLFGDDLPVVSTKGYTGHTLGAGGAVEAVIALECLLRGFVPPSAGATPLDPEVSIRVVTEPLEQPLSTVLSNSFAFGGNNVSVLFGRVS